MKTLKQALVSVLSVALVIILSTGCKKDKDDNSGNARNVKYELTGNFSGKVRIIITDTETGTETINNVSIPWSKEVSYPARTVAVGIGASAETYGKAGETALLRIYSGGSVVKTANGTAGTNGELSLPSLAHGF